MADSWVLRKGRLQTPSGPEGSSGSNRPLVPQGSPAISHARKFLRVTTFEDVTICC